MTLSFMVPQTDCGAQERKHNTSGAKRRMRRVEECEERGDKDGIKSQFDSVDGHTDL